MASDRRQYRHYGSQTAGGEAGSIGIGFAMPINRVKAMLDEYHRNGHISTPVLGVRVTPFLVQGDLAKNFICRRKADCYCSEWNPVRQRMRPACTGPTNV